MPLSNPTVVDGQELQPTRVLLPGGSFSVPPLAFQGDEDLGVYRAGANRLGFVAGTDFLFTHSGGGGLGSVSVSKHGNSSGRWDGGSWGSMSLRCTNAGLNGLAGLQIGPAPGLVGNGEDFRVGQLAELLTIAAATETDSTIQIPLNAVPLAVCFRVTVQPPGTSTFSLGVVGDAARFNSGGAGFSTAAATTGTGYEVDGSGLVVLRPYSGGAASIRVTPNTTPSDASGRIRLYVLYFLPIPATS
jgi:hypothetical protein